MGHNIRERIQRHATQDAANVNRKKRGRVRFFCVGHTCYTVNVRACIGFPIQNFFQNGANDMSKAVDMVNDDFFFQKCQIL